MWTAPAAFARRCLVMTSPRSGPIIRISSASRPSSPSAARRRCRTCLMTTTCALSYDYDPNGNLKFKSDVGALTYGDPLHPHAVTSAGGDSFGYNAVGNQNTRPGGATLTYTPFDLPRMITQGASVITFAYDGDEQRIRKTTPKEETIYFGDLYERVTAM